MSDAAVKQVEVVEATPTTVDTKVTEMEPTDEGAEVAKVAPPEANVKLTDTPFKKVVS